MNRNGLRRMTKADHAYHHDEKKIINGLSPNVVTITVYFIRPIRDLALCERFRIFVPQHWISLDIRFLSEHFFGVLCVRACTCVPEKNKNFCAIEYRFYITVGCI